MVVRFFDSFSGSWGTAGAYDGSYEDGNALVFQQDGQISALRWYRGGTGSTWDCRGIDLWDDYTKQLVVGGKLPTDNGAVGWKTATLSPAIDVPAGRPMRIATRRQLGDYGATVAGTPGWAIDNALGWQDPCFGQSRGSTPLWPGASLTSNAVVVGLDVDFTPGASGGTPLPSATAIDTSLTAWLADNGDNTHRAGDAVPGLPDVTNNNVLAWLARGGEITSGDVSTYGLRDATLAGAAVKILNYLIANGSNINGLISALNTVKGWLGTNGSAPSGWDMYGQVQDMATQIYAIKAKVDLLATPPPATSWVSQGTMDFDTNLAWAQEADVYTVTYSGLGSNIVNLTIGAAEVSYRLAWWAVWDGERMRDRRFADGIAPVLWDGGARMPGIVLHCPGGATGTVEAWLLT